MGYVFGGNKNGTSSFSLKGWGIKNNLRHPWLVHPDLTNVNMLLSLLPIFFLLLNKMLHIHLKGPTPHPIHLSPSQRQSPGCIWLSRRSSLHLPRCVLLEGRRGVVQNEALDYVSPEFQFCTCSFTSWVVFGKLLNLSFPPLPHSSLKWDK